MTPTAHQRCRQFADLYRKIGATAEEVAEEVRAQSEADWEMVAGVLGVPAPKLAENREVISRIVEDEGQ